MFPLGEYEKSTVRQMAKDRNLYTASKKDSQGICFVGQVGIRDFLNEYVKTEPGDIIDKKSGRVIGRHNGAIFYTLGQRHGLDVGGGRPYYVVGKDMSKNIVLVTTDLNDQSLWLDNIELQDVNWINDPPQNNTTYFARVRHQAPLVQVEYNTDNGRHSVRLAEKQRAVTAGQSVVLYDNDICLGGGVVA